jgi:anti-sigma factor RsiW
MTMKCAKFHKMIGDALDGTIRPQDRARLDDHLKSCPECRELAGDFQKIAAEARALPQDEPADDVWPAIRANVGRARDNRPAPAFAHPRLKWGWAAGFLFFGAMIGVVVGLRPWKADVPTAFAADQNRTVAKLEEAEKHYQLAIQAMTEALAPGKNGLDPQTAALFKRDLLVVDAAIESCRTAVAGDPASLDARVFLLGAYQKKIEVLNGFIDIKKKNPAGPGL